MLAPPAPGALRLVGFNLFSGRSMLDGRIDADRARMALAGLGADVLALQEVDAHQPRSGGVHQGMLAAEAMGVPATDRHLRFVPTVVGTPGEPGWRAASVHEPVTDAERWYGIALVSRVPVARWHVLSLAPPRGRYPLPVPGGPPRLMWLRDEPRAVLAAELVEPRVTVACTHLSFVPGVNVRQLRQVRRWLTALPGPVLLLGDLNLPTAMAARFSGGQLLLREPSYPLPRPRVQLDHAIAVRPFPAGTVIRAQTHPLPIGDHTACVVDLAFP